jgi:D-alanyl-D-alanine carboxypeptidase/D-alanyl-D-alanine-endopeptidase (penicillin-binding protein 4)
MVSMKNRTLTLSLLIFIHTSIPFQHSPAAAIEPEYAIMLERKIGERIDAVAQKRAFREVHVAIALSAVEGGQVIYQRNAERSLITASAIKVFPAAVALAKLGPEYRFETFIMTDGNSKEGTLSGDLYLVGRGDPALMPEDLQSAVNEIRKQGIHRIGGDIVYDVSFFDEEKNRYAPHARNLYAPPCALSVNFNTIDVGIDDRGPSPSLWLIPETSYARLRYDIRVEKTEIPGRPVMTYREFSWGDQYSIRGTVTDWDKRYRYLRLGVSRPGLYAATLFQEACKSSGITIGGTIKKGTAPPNARRLDRIASRPLKDIIGMMNQESNNLIAEMVNKNLGAIFGSPPGTRAKGIAIIRRFCVEKIGIPAEELSIHDACGLSAKNRLSASHFIKALNYFSTDPVLAPTFPSTLNRRTCPLTNRGISIHILSKSGTLSVSGVNTEVGYIVLNNTGTVFSFAILANRKQRGPMTYSGTLTNPLLNAIIGAFESD